MRKRPGRSAMLGASGSLEGSCEATDRQRGAADLPLPLLIFRVTSKRSSLAVNDLRLVFLLIISETVQQALLGDDFSVTGACLFIIHRFFALDQTLAWLKDRFKVVERVTEACRSSSSRAEADPREHLDRSLIDEADMLQAARQLQGSSASDQISTRCWRGTADHGRPEGRGSGQVPHFANRAGVRGSGIPMDSCEEGPEVAARRGLLAELGRAVDERERTVEQAARCSWSFIGAGVEWCGNRTTTSARRSRSPAGARRRPPPAPRLRRQVAVLARRLVGLLDVEKKRSKRSQAARTASIVSLDPLAAARPPCRRRRRRRGRAGTRRRRAAQAA